LAYCIQAVAAQQISKSIIFIASMNHLGAAYGINR